MKSQTLEIDEDGDAEMGDPSEFAFAVTRIAVAQICQSVGFKAAQRSALETLTDVAARHLRAMAGSAAASANSSGRSQSNLYDVVRALEDLASEQGFPGASNVNQALLASSPLADLVKFVKYSDEIPFAKPIRRSSPKQSVALPGDSPNPTTSVCSLHIPRWLPAIPDMSASETDRKETQEEEDRSSISIGSGSGSGSSGKVNGDCLVSEKMGIELPEKRPTVRFKLGVDGGGGGGVDMRSGICRGGKRVSCLSRTDGGGRDNKNSVVVDVVVAPRDQDR